MTTRESWTIRAEAPEDRAAVHGVHRAAFEGPDEAALVDSLREDPAWMPGLSLVASAVSGEVIGHVLLTRCFVGQHPALCLAPCGVLPELQGRGIGSALINGALKRARAQGEATAIVLGHPTYYPRFGFEPARPHGIRLSIDVPPDALMVAMLDSTQPVPSGMVRYAEPFGIPVN